MNWINRLGRWGVMALALLPLALAHAADHAESPTVTADPAADIADVFIFRPNQASDRLVAAVTFAGRPSTAAGGVRIDGPVMRCDRNVLYVFNIDHRGDGNLDSVADLKIQARLARNANGQCGVQIEGIPGAGGRVLTGREGSVITDAVSGLRAFAGLVEDPFFFDTVGFSETLGSFAAEGQSGQLRFRSDRDTFGGRNLSAIVFEIDLAAATGGNAGPDIRFWGDTFRFPGTEP